MCYTQYVLHTPPTYSFVTHECLFTHSYCLYSLPACIICTHVPIYVAACMVKRFPFMCCNYKLLFIHSFTRNTHTHTQIQRNTHTHTHWTHTHTHVTTRTNTHNETHTTEHTHTTKHTQWNTRNRTHNREHNTTVQYMRASGQRITAPFCRFKIFFLNKNSTGLNATPL